MYLIQTQWLQLAFLSGFLSWVEYREGFDIGVVSFTLAQMCSVNTVFAANQSKQIGVWTVVVDCMDLWSHIQIQMLIDWWLRSEWDINIVVWFDYFFI